MNNFDRTVGGGIADLVAGHGNVGTPGAFDFAQNSEPVIKMAGGGSPEDYLDDLLNEDFGSTPYQNNQAVIPTAPAPVFSAPAAPAPPAGLASLAQAPAPIAAPIPAPPPLISAPATQYTPPPPPVSTPAPSPFGVSLDQLAPSGLDALTGAGLGISAPASQAPATQAPAPAPAPAPVTQQGYNPYSGELSSALLKLGPASGAEMSGAGKWIFDTKADRDRADYEAQYGFNPESGQASKASYTGTPKYTYTEAEYDPNGYLIKEAQPTGLDPRYNLKDTSGLVHGSKSVWVDPTHMQYTYSFFDPKTGKQVGDQIQETVKVEQSASDKIAGLLMNVAMGAIAGPMAGALGGGALGAGLAGAAMGGAGASVAGGDVLKGALTGGLGAGLGNLASGYINPAAAAASSAVGGGTLGDIVSGATKGALTSGTGALVSGKSITDALLSGALGGGVSSGVNALAGESGLPASVANPLASAATAAILGKDPTMAAINSLIGQITKAGGESGAGMTAGEAEERKGAGETYATLANLPDNQATANAVDTLLKGQDTTVGSGEDLTGGIGDEDLNALLGSGVIGVGTGDGAGTSGATTGEETKGGEAAGAATGDEQTGGTLLDQLTAAGVDTGTAGTSTGYTGEDIEGSGLTEGEAEERAGAGDVADLLSSLGYTSTSGEDEDRAGVASILGDMTDREAEDRAGVSDVLDSLTGNLEEDYVVTDKGTIKSTYSGEEGYFDADGNWVPYTERPPYTSGGTGTTSGTGGTGGTGGTTTKTTTPTTPTAAQSTFDPALLFALSSMFGQQPETPKERENVAKIAAKSAFGALPYQDIVDAYNDIYGA